mgnify:CR=1 FL=1
MLSEVAELVRYDRATGLFYANDGRLLSTRHPAGYVRVKIAGKDVLAHRLAWFIERGDPPAVIDHINRRRDDNRIENLRRATHSENMCNRGPQSNSTSGVSGVAMDTRGKKWQAYIKRHGKRVHLGVFDDFFEAVCARKSAERVYMGEFAPAA